MHAIFQFFDPARYPFLAFATFWFLGSLLGSLIDGWFALARRYCKTCEPAGETRSVTPYFNPVYMRFWTSCGIVRLTAADDALYLSVFFLFRLGHPPLRIPWDQIRFSTCKFRFRDYVVVTLGMDEQIPLRMTPRVASKLGILDRVPDGPALDMDPNFDELSDTFVASQMKKPE